MYFNLIHSVQWPTCFLNMLQTSTKQPGPIPAQYLAGEGQLLLQFTETAGHFTSVSFILNAQPLHAFYNHFKTSEIIHTEVLNYII